MSEITRQTYDDAANELADFFAGSRLREEEPINNHRICSTI